jgi:alpha,alpha-trehalose phosphorylase
MINHSAFQCEPWKLTEVGLDLEVLAQLESVFALSNGHIGWRGNLDEGDPHGLPGTYLNSFYELRPLGSAELVYDSPEMSQTVVNVTNGKLIRLLVDDEPFDVRYGELRRHERTLDLRAGTLERTVEWESPGHRTVRVRSTRLVSFTQRAIAAISYEVEAVDQEVELVFQSELVANEELPAAIGDPRVGAVLEHALVAERAVRADDNRILLVHHTARSGLRVAAMMDHFVLEAPADREIHADAEADLGRISVIARCPAGSKVRFIKFVAYGWSRLRSLPALEDQVAGALLVARRTGFDGLLAAQRQYLDDFWERADVEVEGDGEVQQAVRFALWQVLQAGARTEKRAIPAKGLTGPGYEGHAFWDTEMYVLPVLTYTHPQAVADALEWRQQTLPVATQRATQLGLEGAAFPWRTIHGEECSGYWPAGTAAFHINADVSDAVMQYVWATGDDVFAEQIGLELLVATARLWVSLGHHDPGSGFRIDGVTGPDEYSAIADNNVYTNLMAKRNLLAAANLAARFPVRAAALGVGPEEGDEWRRAAAAMVVPYDSDLMVHAQAEGFTRHDRWNFERTGEDHYPLLLHFPYFDLYRKQVVKQADLVLALFECGDEFTDEEKWRDFDYYEQLTVRDSSLSACIQSIMAAEVGHLDLAYDYLGEAALLDLRDLEHNTRDGLHIASLAGTWLALVAGFGGMRNYGPPIEGGSSLTFRPRLPEDLTRLSFRLVYQGRRLRVTVTPAEATYEVASGNAFDIHHHGEQVTLRPGRAETRPIPPVAVRPPPSQPPGRAPEWRSRRPRPQSE